MKFVVHIYECVYVCVCMYVCICVNNREKELLSSAVVWVNEQEEKARNGTILFQLEQKVNRTFLHMYIHTYIHSYLHHMPIISH